MTIRPAAVAGAFYPAEPAVLKDCVERLLGEAPVGGAREENVKAIIVPHAGYVYSGGVAACAYRCVQNARTRIRRVVLLGPAHRVWLRGMALPSAAGFATPLGDVRIDQRAVERLLSLPGVQLSDEAHALEHALEVQLPFLQCVLDEFQLVPIVVGEAAPGEVARVLDELWGGDDTLVVVSSDLSHYHEYHEAQMLDGRTSAAIERLSDELTGEQACGAHALNGLLYCAGRHQLKARTLDVRSSGDTAGDRRQVVGYGAYLLGERAP